MKKFCLFLLCASCVFCASFSESKKLLKEYFYFQGGGNDFYCDVAFSASNKKGKIVLELLKSSEYEPATKSKNDKFSIDWEHIMPASVFGKNVACWQDGGRKKCSKNEIFKQMESDVMNIVPAIARINRERRNYEYADAPDDIQYTQYGACKVFIDRKKRKIYPRNDSKGYIARSYLYMIEKYGVQISQEQMQLMQKWNALYPATRKELVMRRAMANINKELWVKDLGRDISKMNRFLHNLAF